MKPLNTVIVGNDFTALVAAHAVMMRGHQVRIVLPSDTTSAEFYGPAEIETVSSLLPGTQNLELFDLTTIVQGEPQQWSGKIGDPRYISEAPIASTEKVSQALVLYEVLLQSLLPVISVSNIEHLGEEFDNEGMIISTIPRDATCENEDHTIIRRPFWASTDEKYPKGFLGDDNTILVNCEETPAWYSTRRLRTERGTSFLTKWGRRPPFAETIELYEYAKSNCDCVPFGVAVPIGAAALWNPAITYLDVFSDTTRALMAKEEQR